MAKRKQGRIKKQAKSVANLIVISDTHIGCQAGLCPPSGYALDDGGRYMPNQLQQVVWSWWEEFWNEWVPDVCRGEPFAVCMNGDALDGVHHNSTTQWSHNLKDQNKAAVSVLKDVVSRCEGRYYHIRGTEAHVGQSGAEEERLAEALGAIPNESGQYARWELWLRIGTGLANLTHHIGTAGSLAYETSALMRELSEAYVESGRWNNEAPDWLIRSHRHRNSEIRIQTHKGFATIFTTPAWQLRTPFCFKVAGVRESTPQIGGSLVRCGDEDYYTRHFVKSIARSREESL